MAIQTKVEAEPLDRLSAVENPIKLWKVRGADQRQLFYLIDLPWLGQELKARGAGVQRDWVGGKRGTAFWSMASGIAKLSKFREFYQVS
jgi:hypothetical protein